MRARMTARDRTERAIANTTAALAVETIHKVMDHALRGQALNLTPRQVQALATVLSLAVPRGSVERAGQ